MKFNYRSIALLFGVIQAGTVIASPADYVYTPTVEYGEKEVDFKAGAARLKDRTLTQAASLGFGYGATETWFTEFYLKQETTGNQVANLAEWENKFQLTETGKQCAVGIQTWPLAADGIRQAPAERQAAI